MGWTCLFGRVGLRVILGHLVEMAESLREHLEGHDSTTVLNDDGVGTVTVFRVYPDGVDTWTIKDRERTDPVAREELLRHNDYNRRLFRYLHDRAMRGAGVHPAPPVEHLFRPAPVRPLVDGHRMSRLRRALRAGRLARRLSRFRASSTVPGSSRSASGPPGVGGRSREPEGPVLRHWQWRGRGVRSARSPHTRQANRCR